MLVVIKSKEELLKQTLKPGFTLDKDSGHIIVERGCSMHKEVFEDCGKVISDFVPKMNYRHHCLDSWMVEPLTSMKALRDKIIVSQEIRNAL